MRKFSVKTKGHRKLLTLAPPKIRLVENIFDEKNNIFQHSCNTWLSSEKLDQERDDLLRNNLRFVFFLYELKTVKTEEDIIFKPSHTQFRELSFPLTFITQ